MSIAQNIPRNVPRPLTRAITEAGVAQLPDTMTAELAAGYLYTRAPWSATLDQVQRLRITATPASATANGVVDPFGIRLIPIATARTAMVTAFNASSTFVASQSDDAGPLRYNGTFIGGSHGPFVALAVTSAAHGKTAADIGSLWTTGSAQFRIIRVLSANVLWMMTPNTSGDDELWTFNTTIAATGTMTHVSGATNTAAFNWTARALQQVLPWVQNHTRTIRKNGITPITVDGVYDGNFFEVAETYGIGNPVSMLAYIVAGMPWASQPDLNASAITTQVECAYTYKLMDNGALTIDGRIVNAQRISLAANVGYYGITQTNPITFNAGAGETLWFYVPRVNAVSGFDAEATTNISGAIATTDYTSATWKDAANPPDRSAQFVKTSGSVNKQGFVQGYSRISGAGADLADYINKSGFLSGSTKKMYIQCLTNNAVAFGSPGTTLPAGSVFEATAYRIPYNLADTPEATVLAVREFTGGAEVILDFHENVSDYAITVPANLNGKAVTVVDGNGSLTLDTVVVEGGAFNITVTDNYGAAVLRIS